MTTRTLLPAAALLIAALAVGGTDAQASDTVGPRLQATLYRAARAPDTTYPGVALYVRRPGHAPPGRVPPARRASTRSGGCARAIASAPAAS